MQFLPLLLLLFAAFAQAASADASEKSVQQKFDELVEAGYFEGYSDGISESGSISRAQLARLLALLNGLATEDSGGENSGSGDSCGYSDVDPSGWQSDYIMAVTKAKLMNGVGGCKFDPYGDVTHEQLIAVTVRALNLQVYDVDAVQGEVSDWAKQYVATALENGLFGPRDDYTVPANHNSLVEAAYNMNEQLVEENGFGITTAKQIGAKRIEVRLNAPPDPSDIEIAVVRGSDRMSVDVESLEWSEYGYLVVLRLAEPLDSGPYEVSISGSDSIDPNRAAYEFMAEAERVSRLEWGGPDTLPYNDNVEVPFFVLNQFDEAMDAKDIEIYFAATNASIERIPERSAVLVHLLAKAKPGDNVDLTILYAKSGLFKTKTYQVGKSRVVSAIEIDGVPAEPLESGQSAELIVRAYDQYGGPIKDGDWLKRELVASSENTRLVIVSPLEMDGSGNIVLRANASVFVWEDATVNITVSARSGSASATATLTVKQTKDAFPVPIVYIPPGNPTVTDEVYTVGSNFAHVTIGTDNATQVYYYYERKGVSPDGYPASEVMNKALAKQQGDSVAVSADKASFTLLDLDFGREYELFVVAANSSGRLSDVQVYEFSTDYLSSYLSLVYDGSNPDTGRCVFVFDSSHEFNPNAYYLLADQPVHATASEIIDRGTKVDDGKFVFELNGRVQYLYVVYDIGGEYELFAYASDTFPEFL
jgi:hypothetical protein